MAWMQEIDIWEHGVQLPTGGHWVDIPGSPFQVMARDTDTMGTVSIRFQPAMAEHWSEFIEMVESGDR